jgi:hypothetical protein
LASLREILTAAKRQQAHAVPDIQKNARPAKMAVFKLELFHQESELPPDNTSYTFTND